MVASYIVRWVAPLIAVIASLCVGSASGQYHGMYVVDESGFRAACEHLSLSEAQEKQVMELFGRYVIAVAEAEAVREDAVKKADEEVGLVDPPEWADLDPIERHRLRQAQRTPEAMRRRNRVVQESMEAARVEETLARQTLFAELRGILSESQQECLLRVEWLTRRLAIATRAKHPQAMRQNLFDFVELRLLLEGATSEGAELESVEVPCMCRSGGERDSLGAAIAEIVEHYEEALDGHLVSAPGVSRNLHRARDRANARDDGAGVERFEQQIAESHLRPFVLLRDAVAAIGLVIRSELGDAAADAWLDRCHSAMFPLLYQTETPERMFHWLRDLPELPQDAAEGAETIFNEYLSSRRALRNQFMSLEFEIRSLPQSHPRRARLETQRAAVQAERHGLAEATNKRLRELAGHQHADTFDQVLAQSRRLREIPSREAPP